MKNLLVLAIVGLALVGCASTTRITLLAEIPDTQEVSISIDTKDKSIED